MKKTAIITATLFIISSLTSYCQISFSNEQIIDTIGSFVHVHAVDLDGDGDNDVISNGLSTIEWYRNDGFGNLSSSISIEQHANGSQCVYSADVDGDDDMDILVDMADQICWYRNNGVGEFSSELIISDQVNNSHCIYAEDLDGDGDIDIMSASVNDDKIAWYENDGLGNFGTQQVISNSTNGASCVYAGDLDNDGDIDIVAGGAHDATLSWYENTNGAGDFGEQQVIASNADGIQFVYTADLNNDGYLDIYYAAMGANKVVWYENDDNQDFSYHQIDFHTSASDVCAMDFDNDGDLDLVASADNDNLMWYQNDSTGSFVNYIVSGILCRSVYSCELNGDGYNDILTASSSQQKISWYQNLWYVNTNLTLIEDLYIYPNPTNGIITVSVANISEIEITNSIGQVIFQFAVEKSPFEIDMRNQIPGIYFINTTTEKETITEKVIVE